MNQLLCLIYALLSLSIIVSLFGIVNTLVLSIHERTREIGMMRAIGTSRRQVRRIVRYESVITALIGARARARDRPAARRDDDRRAHGRGLHPPDPGRASLIVFLVLGRRRRRAGRDPAGPRASRLNVLEALAYE